MSSTLLMRVVCTGVAVGLAVGADRAVAMGTISGDCNNGDAVGGEAIPVAVGLTMGSAVGSLDVGNGVLATTTVGTAMAGVGSATVAVMASDAELHAATTIRSANIRPAGSRLRRLN